MELNVLTISLTEAGRNVATRLPYRHMHGELAANVRAEWPNTDAFVLCCSVGVAVRIIAPLLTDKASDPAVICIDEAAEHVIAVCGGHRGANQVAREVAALLGARPVVSTATDQAGVVALDTLPGFLAVGDIAGVTRAMLDGGAPSIDNPLGWPLAKLPQAPSATQRIVVTDQVTAPESGLVVLHPPSLVVGLGGSSNATPAEARALVDATLKAEGLSRHSISGVATVDLRHSLAASLGYPTVSFSPTELAAIDVPNPSDVVASAIGTPSVAEAAALAAAGPGAELLVTKTKAATVTVAIARRARPAGSLAVVGLGPGSARHRTPAAAAAVRQADVIIGYGPYLELCADLHEPRHELVASPIGAETDRCEEALRRAGAGQRVALVCSGDAGVFAMATLVYELSGRFGQPPVEVVPGITASLTAASLLGAPLAHDHALISLSDLLTPWPTIEARIRAIAASDMAVAFYNPRSQRRTWQLETARDLLLEHRLPATPVGIVSDAGRPGQRIQRTTLATFDPAAVDMLSIVIVGSSTTRWLGEAMVTPRGYAT